MTNNDVIEQIHDVIVTRNRYYEYAIRAMRDATEEELQSANEYVKSISKETGVDFLTEVSAMDEKKETKDEVFEALLQDWYALYLEYIDEHGGSDDEEKMIKPEEAEFRRRWKNAI